MSLPAMYERLASEYRAAMAPPDPNAPYWHRFRVHLDSKSDELYPEGFYLVWHRRRR